MSRAEDFPPEIVDHILFYVGNSSYHSSGELVHKRGLYHCSLTCRYWAERTAVILFDTILLRSDDDLQILLRLMSTSPRNLASYIRALRVVQSDDTSEPPWIHHVLLSLGHKLPNLSEMNYYDAEVRPATHPHPLLPQRLPAFFSPFNTIEDLWLHDHLFHSFADFMHLVGRLHNLRSLSCGRLTWINQPRNMPQSRARFPSRLRSVSFLQCQAVWPVVWLFTSPAASSRTFSLNEDRFSLHLDTMSVGVINDVVRCFLSHEKMESSSFSLERADTHIWHLKCENSLARMRPDEPRSEEPCAPDIIFALAPSTDSISSVHQEQATKPFPGRFVHIESITFARFKDSINPYRTHTLSSMPWERLEDILSEAQMSNVKICIYLPAGGPHHVRDYEELEDAILAKMPSMRLEAGEKRLFHRVGWQREAALGASPG